MKQIPFGNTPGCIFPCPYAATNAAKGVFGEYVIDQFLHRQGLIKLNDGGVLTQLGSAPHGTGIDGVWAVPPYPRVPPPNQYVISETKYNTSKQKTTGDGYQMSVPWINGSDRLPRALGDNDLADDVINEQSKGNVTRVLAHVSEKNEITVTELDIYGKKVKQLHP